MVPSTVAFVDDGYVDALEAEVPSGRRVAKDDMAVEGAMFRLAYTQLVLSAWHSNRTKDIYLPVRPRQLLQFAFQHLLSHLPSMHAQQQALVAYLDGVPFQLRHTPLVFSLRAL